MYELTFDEELPPEKFHTHNGEWIECAKCQALMFDTFKSCWSCGISFTDKNKVAVSL